MQSQRRSYTGLELLMIVASRFFMIFFFFLIVFSLDRERRLVQIPIMVRMLKNVRLSRSRRMIFSIGRTEKMYATMVLAAGAITVRANPVRNSASAVLSSAI